MNRPVPALIATAALLLGMSACGSSNHDAQLGATTTQTGAIAFSGCMRGHGVADFPDPGSNGAIPKVALQQLGVSSSLFLTAQRTCQHLLPNGGRPPGQARQQEIRAIALKFSRCVRAHGVPNFPDPDSTGRIPDPATVRVDQGSPSFEAANRACAAYRPPYMPSNAAYNAWARAHGGS